MRMRTLPIAVAVALAIVAIYFAWASRPATLGADRARRATNSAPEPSNPAVAATAPGPRREHEEFQDPATPAEATPTADAADAKGYGGSILLHVVDRDSRAELSDVTVFIDSRRSFNDVQEGPPPEALGARLFEHAPSPLRITMRRDDQGWVIYEVVWVRADGHSWAHPEIGFTAAPDVTVELVPAADLTVDLRGRLPDATHGTVHLRLRDPKFPDEYPLEGESEDERSLMSRIVFDAVAKSGANEITGLLPHPLRVAVELGDNFPSPLVLASTSVNLVAGETTRATLVVPEVAPAVRVPLSGTLFVPPGWPVAEWAANNEEETPDDQLLRIEPIGLKGTTEDDDQSIALASMTPIEGKPGAYRWQARPVQPARYGFRLEAAGFAQAVDVPSTGLSDVELVLPEAASLRVRIVSARDGSPVRFPQLWWRPTPKWASDLSFGVPLVAESSLDDLGGHVPIGPGRVTALVNDDWRLDPATTSAEIHPGLQELTVKVSHLLHVTLHLACCGRPVPWPRSPTSSRIEPVGAAGGYAFTSWGDDSLRFGLTSPGRYRITLAPLANYADVSPFELDVPDDDVERTIELKPLMH